jgi:hypothetical protein
MTPDVFAMFVASGQAAPKELAGGLAQPYVMFYDKRANVAGKVAAKFPHVGMGDPILVDGAEFHEIRTASFTILDEFQHWTENDGEGKPTAWRVDQPSSKDWKENVLCLMLLFPQGAQPILTLTGLRTTKCPIAHDFLREVKKATSAEGVKANARYGAMASAKFPDRYRVTGTFRMTPKTGKNPYVLGAAVCGPISDEHAAQAMAWFGSAEGKEEYADLRKAFDEQVVDVKKKAAK